MRSSRLQSYCPDLGFIASARIDLSQSDLSRLGFKRVIATKLKGFPREVVIVREQDYASLDDTIRDGLFAEINAETRDSGRPSPAPWEASRPN